MLHIRKISFKENNSIILWTIYPNDLYSNNLSFLDKKEIKLIHSFKNNLRKNEFIASRMLLKSILPTAKIDYEKNGKPFLIDREKHISISHSKQIVSIIISSNPNCAIDVQIISEKVCQLRNKFLSNKECKLINEEDALKNTLAWSIKETLFKSINLENVPYKSSLLISEINENNAFCEISHEQVNKNVVVNYKVFDNFVMTYIS